MYTTASAFFEAIKHAGVTHCFVNLGSDHPAILEAILEGQQNDKDFPRIITCPHEVRVAWLQGLEYEANMDVDGCTVHGGWFCSCYRQAAVRYRPC